MRIILIYNIISAICFVKRKKNNEISPSLFFKSEPGKSLLTIFSKGKLKPDLMERLK